MLAPERKNGNAQARFSAESATEIDWLVHRTYRIQSKDNATERGAAAKESGTESGGRSITNHARELGLEKRVDKRYLARRSPPGTSVGSVAANGMRTTMNSAKMG